MSVTNHNDIVTLRTQLFASLDRLSAATIDPKEVERAKAIAETAQTIINSAKVEVDFIRATGNPGGSGFIPLAERHSATLPKPK